MREQVKRALALPARVADQLPLGDLIARGSTDAALVASALRFAVPEVLVAVVHAVETQRTTARGHENNGSFRAGITAIKDGGAWRIARIQLSGPMIEPGQRPPFAR
jgi:hypothetical protein